MKQERYVGKDGKDLIDRWEEKYTIEEFRLVMWSVIERYNERLGKKDDPVQEVAKMADYIGRWLNVERKNKNG